MRSRSATSWRSWRWVESGRAALMNKILDQIFPSRTKNSLRSSPGPPASPRPLALSASRPPARATCLVRARPPLRGGARAGRRGWSPPPLRRANLMPRSHARNRRSPPPVAGVGPARGRLPPRGGAPLRAARAARGPRREARRRSGAARSLLRLLAAVAALHLPSAAPTLSFLGLLLQGIAFLGLAAVLVFDLLLPLARIRVPRIGRDVAVALSWVALLLWLFSVHEVDVSGIVATSAVVTAVIGFSLQDTLANVMGGIALQLEGAFAPGRLGEVRRHLGPGDGDGLAAHGDRDAQRRHAPRPQQRPREDAAPPARAGRRAEGRRSRGGGSSSASTTGASPVTVLETVREALTREPIPNVAAEPAPSVVLMDFRESWASYAARYWLTDLLPDDPTDSIVRTRIVYALKRAGIPLVDPGERQLRDGRGGGAPEAARGDARRGGPSRGPRERPALRRADRRGTRAPRAAARPRAVRPGRGDGRPGRARSTTSTSSREARETSASALDGAAAQGRQPDLGPRRLRRDGDADGRAAAGHGDRRRGDGVLAPRQGEVPRGPPRASRHRRGDRRGSSPRGRWSSRRRRRGSPRNPGGTASRRRTARSCSEDRALLRPRRAARARREGRTMREMKLFLAGRWEDGDGTASVRSPWDGRPSRRWRGRARPRSNGPRSTRRKRRRRRPLCTAEKRASILEAARADLLGAQGRGRAGDRRGGGQADRARPRRGRPRGGHAPRRGPRRSLPRARRARPLRASRAAPGGSP